MAVALILAASTILSMLLQVGLAIPASAQFGGYGRPWYRIHLDKTQYQAGDVVIINVEGGVAGQPSNELALVKIFGLGSDPTERNIVNEETKRLQNGWAEFNYEIPLSSASNGQSQDLQYRYLVQVFGVDTNDGGSNDNGNELPNDQAIFFTEDAASNIIISDLKIAINNTARAAEGPQDNNTISKGSLDLEFRVTDGLGNPIADAMIGPTFFYQSCENGRNGLASDLSMKDYYNNTGLVRANITLLDDLEPGIYDSLFIDAQSQIGIGYQEARDIVTLELSDVGDSNGSDVLQAKLVDIQTVGSGNHSPPKWPTKISTINVDGNDNTLTVRSDNRICDYEYSGDKKMLSLHVASTELPQFMEVAIPYNLTSADNDASSIYSDINGYRPPSELNDEAGSYILSFKYTGCVLDLYTSCNIHIHGIETRTSSGSLTPETSINSTTTVPCTYDFNADVHQNVSRTLDNDKAISLATSNNEFQSKVYGYRATFNSIFTTWQGDKERCTNNLETVNVVYSLYDKGNGYVKNVVVTLDPGLNHVINVTEQEGGYYGGSSGSSGEELIAHEQNQINNAMYIIGIGAVISGIIAFMTLRKRKK